MSWPAYTNENRRRFEQEVRIMRPNDCELNRIIQFAIRSQKIWAIEIFVKYHNNIAWLVESCYIAAVSDAIHVIRYLEKNPLFEPYMFELAISNAAQSNSTRALKHLLDYYKVRSIHDLFTHGLYFTFPKTVEIIANHPKTVDSIYKPYRHENVSCNSHINGVLERQREKRRRRNWQLMYLYAFLVSWAQEVKARPGNSDYLAAMKSFYQMVAEDEGSLVLEQPIGNAVLETNPV